LEAFFSLLVIALALITSVVTFILLYRSRKKRPKIQDRPLEIEQARDPDNRKANLVARLLLEPDPARGLYTLRVENEGPGEARNIHVRADVRQPGPYEQFARIHLHTIAYLGRSYVHPQQLYTSKEPDFTIDVSIHWSDDSGENGSYRTTLMSPMHPKEQIKKLEY